MRFGDAGGHDVEGLPQPADFVAAVRTDAPGIVARRHRIGGIRHLLERRSDAGADDANRQSAEQDQRHRPRQHSPEQRRGRLHQRRLGELHPDMPRGAGNGDGRSQVARLSSIDKAHGRVSRWEDGRSSDGFGQVCPDIAGRVAEFQNGAAADQALDQPTPGEDEDVKNRSIDGRRCRRRSRPKDDRPSFDRELASGEGNGRASAGTVGGTTAQPSAQDDIVTSACGGPSPPGAEPDL